MGCSFETSRAVRFFGETLRLLGAIARSLLCVFLSGACFRGVGVGGERMDDSLGLTKSQTRATWRKSLRQAASLGSVDRRSDT